MDNCIFCKIVKKDIPTKIVFENDDVLAFYDLQPQAPTHILIIPKQHIQSIDEITDENCHVVSKIFCAAKTLAFEHHLSNGYRIVNNCGHDGGQTVNHLHFHLLGGRKMGWPPG